MAEGGAAVVVDVAVAVALAAVAVAVVGSLECGLEIEQM
jgi:hypothetical protein